MFVYQIRNIVNNKIYIGKTVNKNLQSYFQHNLRLAESGRKDKNYLYSAIRKCGSKSFKIEILCRPASENLMSALECWYIGFYTSNNPHVGYNLTRGGDGVSGMKQSELAKRKVRERSIGNTWRRGKKASEETKRLSRESIKRTFDRGRKIWNSGKTWSEEIRKKMSLSAKRRWMNASEIELINYREKGRLNADKRWQAHGRQ